MLNLQLAVLQVDPHSSAQRSGKSDCRLLEENRVSQWCVEQMPLIQEIQTDEWWQDVTTPMLEIVRRRLRALVKLIEKQQRKPIYTDFEDELGGETMVELPPFTAPDSFERFRAKTRQFLREHEDDLVIHKLRMNEPLTATDLQELERMLTRADWPAPIICRSKNGKQRTRTLCALLGGLEARSSETALAGFVAGKTLSANQIEFVNLIVDHLTEHGAMNPELLYESPFTDLTPQGPEGIFNSAQVDELVALLSELRTRAVA